MNPITLLAYIVPALFALEAVRLYRSGRRYRRIQHGIYWT